MDPITHGFLGSSFAQTTASKTLGLRALIISGLVAMTPDLDKLVEPFVGPLQELYYHRWVTHSVFFGPVMGPILGFFIWTYYGKKYPAEKTFKHFVLWSACFCFALLSHAFLDCTTSYGTQLFAPFTNTRVAWHIIAIIDPFYSFILFMGVVLGIVFIKKNQPQKATLIGYITLALSTLYLGLGFYMGHECEKHALNDLVAKGRKGFEVTAYPTLLQLHFRRVIATSPHEHCIGYTNYWHQAPITWKCFQENFSPASSSIKNSTEGKFFTWFAMGKVRTESTILPDGLIEIRLIDLRYGFTETDSLWGISGQFNPATNSLSNIQYFHKVQPLNSEFIIKTLKKFFS